MSKNGKPLPHSTININAVDLIATVSGCNFSTVAKVVAAIQAIELHTPFTLNELVDIESIPDAPPNDSIERMIPDGYMVELAERIVKTLPRKHVVAMRLYRFLPAANAPVARQPVES